MLKSIFKNVASTHRRVLCVSNACDICSVKQRQNSLLLPLQTSSAQRMRAIVSLSWHTWPRSHKEWGSSWHGRDEERRRTARATRACLALPGRFSLLRSIQGCGNISILASKDESSIPQGLQHLDREEFSSRSSLGQSDLRNPLVIAATFFTEQVKLLQSWILPWVLSWVLLWWRKMQV